MPLVDPKNKSSQEFNPNVDNSEIAATPNKGGVIVTYLSFILILPLILYIWKRNKLVKLQMRINQSASGIDIQLKKRHDTLGKLIDSVKGSMKFEKELLADITKLRQINGPQNIQQGLDKGNAALSRIMATFEAYPNIKSTTAVQQTMSAIEDIEREIAAARRLYNSYVNSFNTGIFTWPGSIVAGGMHLTKLPLFTASETDKQDIKVNF